MYFFLYASLILFIMQVVIGLWVFYLFPAIGYKLPVFAVPAVLTVLMRFAMSYTRTHFGTLESVAYYLCYAWGGLVFMLFFLTVGLAAVQWILSFFHLASRPVMGVITLTLAGIIVLFSIYGGLQTPKLKTVDVLIPGAPSFKAAILSDSHLGVGVSLPRFKKALATLQAQNPDALFVLGDVFEFGPNRAAYATELANFKTPLGSFGVLGNHEYYTGYETAQKFYQQAGINLLENRTVTLPNGVQLSGVNDIKTTQLKADKFNQLLTQTDTQNTHILLSHQPLLTQEASDAGVDLMLSGHTHNGQIFPFNYFVKLQYPHNYGLYGIGPMNLYVTSGLFYWGVPLRFLTRSEAPIIRINP